MSCEQAAMLSKDLKKLFLSEMLLRRDIIFCNFDNVLDGRKKKKNAWVEIQQVLKANGTDIEYHLLRDREWKNIRSATLKKLDNRRQTGSGGGAENVLNQLDELVVAIIGENSPVFQGLPVTESVVDADEELTQSIVQQAGEGKTFTVMQVQKKSPPQPRQQPSMATLMSNKSASTVAGSSGTHMSKKRSIDEVGVVLNVEKERLIIKQLKLRNRNLQLKNAILENEAKGMFVPISDDEDDE